MKAVLILENGEISLVDKKFDLAELQKTVGGYIQDVPLSDGLSVIVNEEGRLVGSEPNQMATTLASAELDKDNRYLFGGGLVGPALFIGVDGEDYCDVPRWFVDAVHVGE